MAIKEEFDKIFRKHWILCNLHAIEYSMGSTDYTYHQRIKDAVTLAYYEVRDYRYNEKELLKYATNIFLKYFPNAIKLT